MDLKERSSSETWTKLSTSQNKMFCNSSPSNQSFTILSSHQQQNLGAPSVLYFGQLDRSLEKSSLLNANLNIQKSITNQEGEVNRMLGNGRTQDWDPRSMLNNLSFLKWKIHQLQGLIHLISRRSGNIPGGEDELLIQQQQLITTDLTSILVQLISTASNLLPSEKHSLSDTYLKTLGQPGYGTKMNGNIIEEEHEPKDDDDGKEENLPPGSYEILQLEKEEILAPHTHFCTICGKGFKRDANLRMHMRGHGDEYKTTAALAKPNKDSNSEQVIVKRYSCPFVGCKRNKDHKKFQPLKTILCVKNHYKRTHCDKRYICSRCHVKKFSVIADLKTHEKHCGRDKWLCSCGTTFSRKDKLFGHIALFQGHTPAIPLDGDKPSVGPSNPTGNSKVTDKDANVGFGFSSNVGEGDGIQSMIDMKGNVEDPLFSFLNYDCSFGGLQEFLQGNFDDSPNSFSFLASEERNVMQSDTNNMDQ